MRTLTVAQGGRDDSAFLAMLMSRQEIFSSLDKGALTYSKSRHKFRRCPRTQEGCCAHATVCSFSTAWSSKQYTGTDAVQMQAPHLSFRPLAPFFREKRSKEFIELCQIPRQKFALQVSAACRDERRMATQLSQTEKKEQHMRVVCHHDSCCQKTFKLIPAPCEESLDK